MFSFIFTQFWQQKIIYLHRPDHVRTSPNTIFSDGMCRIKAQSSENYLKMFSDQKRQNKKKKTLKSSYAEILIIYRLDVLMAGDAGLFIWEF